MLPLFSKIFEKLIYSRLTTFFDNQGIINTNQYGFRKNHSTTHALHAAITRISKVINSKQCSFGVFIHFSKALDTVQHNILLNKLEHYGVRGKSLELLSSYLSERKQYCQVQSTTSETLDITCVVRHGSVLGPLFFLIYINDISNCACQCNGSDCIKNCSDNIKCIVFADDTNIFFNDDNLELQNTRVNSFLERLAEYLDSNYLHINLTKTKYMVFDSPRGNIHKHYKGAIEIIYNYNEHE